MITTPAKKIWEQKLWDLRGLEASSLWRNDNLWWPYQSFPLTFLSNEVEIYLFCVIYLLKSCSGVPETISIPLPLCTLRLKVHCLTSQHRFVPIKWKRWRHPEIVTMTDSPAPCFKAFGGKIEDLPTLGLLDSFPYHCSQNGACRYLPGDNLCSGRVILLQ